MSSFSILIHEAWGCMHTAHSVHSSYSFSAAEIQPKHLVFCYLGFHLWSNMLGMVPGFLLHVSSFSILISKGVCTLHTLHFFFCRRNPTKTLGFLLPFSMVFRWFSAFSPPLYAQSFLKPGKSLVLMARTKYGKYMLPLPHHFKNLKLEIPLKFKLNTF